MRSSEALVERSYEKPLRTAKALSSQTEISPFTRMAMIFQACRNSSAEFVRSGDSEGTGAQEKAFIHQKYINHIITELKPVLAEIIRQGIRRRRYPLRRPRSSRGDRTDRAYREDGRYPGAFHP